MQTSTKKCLDPVMVVALCSSWSFSQTHWVGNKSRLGQLYCVLTLPRTVRYLVHVQSSLRRGRNRRPQADNQHVVFFIHHQLTHKNPKQRETARWRDGDLRAVGKKSKSSTKRESPSPIFVRKNRPKVHHHHHRHVLREDNRLPAIPGIGRMGLSCSRVWNRRRRSI